MTARLLRRTDEHPGEVSLHIPHAKMTIGVETCPACGMQNPGASSCQYCGTDVHGAQPIGRHPVYTAEIQDVVFHYTPLTAREKLPIERALMGGVLSREQANRFFEKLVDRPSIVDGVREVTLPVPVRVPKVAFEDAFANAAVTAGTTTETGQTGWPWTLKKREDGYYLTRPAGYEFRIPDDVGTLVLTHRGGGQSKFNLRPGRTAYAHASPYRIMMSEAKAPDGYAKKVLAETPAAFWRLETTPQEYSLGVDMPASGISDTMAKYTTALADRIARDVEDLIINGAR